MSISISKWTTRFMCIRTTQCVVFKSRQFCSDHLHLAISPGHWACLSNKFSPAGQVDLYDSLHTRPNKDGTIVPQACLILHTSEPQLTLRVVNVGIQQGYDDCGLFSVAMAYDLCSGVDPSTKLYVQDQMSHLHSCFNNKQRSPFHPAVQTLQ